MGKMNPVVHFEIGYKDKQRMMDFYSKVFGWQMQQFGPETGNYVVVTTTEVDEKTQRPKMPGAINGGFYQKNENPLSQAPSVVVAVDDIRAAMKEVEETGGKILGTMNANGEHTMEPSEIPGVGLWMSVMDTEDNRFSLLQPKQM